MGLETQENKNLLPEDQKPVTDIIDKNKSDPDFVVNETDNNENFNKSKEFLAAKKAFEENKALVEQSNAVVEDMQGKYFKDMVYLFSFFGSSPKTGTTIDIIDCPALKQNGKDNISPNSLSETNDEQKKEIVKAFMTLPESVLRLLVTEYNKPNKLNTITDEDLNGLISGTKEYQGYQSKIEENNAIIKYSRQPETTPISGDVNLADYKENQKIGILFELPENQQEGITEKLNSIKNTYKEYSISEINLVGYADATPVTPKGKVLIQEQFTKHLALLKDKGFNVTSLPVDYDHFGQWLFDNGKITENQITNTDIVSNRGFAFTRAIMQLSRMSPEQMKNISKSNLVLDIDVSDKVGDWETAGGIEFRGSGTTIDGPEKFKITAREASEVLIKTDLKIAVKVGDKVRIFRFEKQDDLNRDGTTNNVGIFAKLVDVGSQGTHGNEKSTLSYMKEATKYGGADFGGPVFFINISDADNVSAENKSIVDKITNSNLDNPEAIPSVNELLNLYASLGGSQTETQKFKTMYALQK